MRSVICIILWLYFVVFIVRILLSWFPLEPGGVGLKVFGFVARLTDPVLRPLRSVLRPIPIGGMALDLSPMIPMFVLIFLTNIIC